MLFDSVESSIDARRSLAFWNFGLISGFSVIVSLRPFLGRLRAQPTSIRSYPIALGGLGKPRKSLNILDSSDLAPSSIRNMRDGIFDGTPGTIEEDTVKCP